MQKKACGVGEAVLCCINRTIVRQGTGGRGAERFSGGRVGCVRRSAEGRSAPTQRLPQGCGAGEVKRGCRGG